MKAFAFELGQRVNVPDWGTAQGMVTLPTGQSNYVGVVSAGEHLFYVTWIDARGQPIDSWFSESELLKANPSPTAEADLEAKEAQLARMHFELRDPPQGDTTISLSKRPKRKSKSRKRRR